MTRNVRRNVHFGLICPETAVTFRGGGRKSMSFNLGKPILVLLILAALSGAATFLKVPALTQVLDSVPAGSTLHVPLSNLNYIDHSCLELLEDWSKTSGSTLRIEQRGLKRRVEGRLRSVAGT